jgi:SAM-dependent methyltransferase
MDCKEKFDCICCGENNLVNVLDLGNQPLANSYHDNSKLLDVFPLKLNLCKNCFHLQLSHIVNPDLLFRNYLYVSGTSGTLHKYFKWFVNFISEYTKRKIGSVLDIACNDGTQLDYFKNNGWETYGIDPSKNLYEISSKNHNIICDYFSYKHYNKKFDVVIAQNVFAHNENAKDFLDSCYELMSDDSYLFIQTSQSEMIENNEFDTIYHEHLSYFNINSFNELVKKTKLHLIDVIKSPVHGISYIFVLSKKNINNHLIENLIEIEKVKGLLNLKTYDFYKDEVQNLIKNFIKKIEFYKKKNYIIVGYGAAAKGMTFLNFSNVRMDFIIDDNPLKHNLYTPGTNIKIVPIDYLNNFDDEDKILFVPLAWNFFDEIKFKVSQIRKNKYDKYLKYFPKVKVIDC